MRYLLLFICILTANSFAVDMEPLPVGNGYRQLIAQSLRQEEKHDDFQFNIRRIERNKNIAYFCGLIKDKQDNFALTKNGGFHIYDRIMIDAGTHGWKSAVSFDREVATLDEVHCHFAKEQKLDDQQLHTLVEAQGRSALCQPVRQQDPLRNEILDALRAGYIGDSNTLEFNQPKPPAKFIVKELCATNDHAYFCGKATGEARSPYEDEESFLEIILKRNAQGKWHAVPENGFITQQSAVSWCDAEDDARSATALAKKAAAIEQACLVEGDTRSVTGVLLQKSAGDETWWVVQPGQPFHCVRDADTHRTDWNQEVELVLTAQEGEALSPLSGKKIRVGGDILLALSTHHHTSLLLDNIFMLQEEK